MRMNTREKQLVADGADKHRDILKLYTLKGAREFYKLHARIDKESRALDFLINKMIESENDLVQAIADYMPMGTGLILRSTEECAYFLGDVKLNGNIATSGNAFSSYSSDVIHGHELLQRCACAD
jgi:hypothetical protein